MIIYRFYVDWDDDGNFDAPDEDVTADVIDAAWRLGFHQPFEAISPPGRARLTLLNADRRYSPETGQRPIAPGLLARIESDDGTTTRVHFTGQIASVTPQAGDHGARLTVLHLTTVDAQLRHLTAALTPLANVTAGETLARLWDSLPLRRYGLAGVWVLDLPEHSAVGAARVAADIPTPRAFDDGISVFSYIGVDWRGGIRADQAVRALVESERGRFFIDRAGTARFFHRHRLLIDSAPAATLTDSMRGLLYRYGADAANRIRVTIRPRSVGAAGTPLWTLANPQKLPPGERRFVARFRDAAGMRIGALTLDGLTYSANAKPDGSGAVKLIDVRVVSAYTDAAEIAVYNSTGETVWLLAGAQITGTPVTFGAPITLEHADGAGIALHSARVLMLDLPLMDSLDEADGLARYERLRRSLPRGTVRSVETTTADQPAHALALTLFDRIRIVETQTGHSADYLIIGERHRIEAGGARHTVRWLLERAESDRFWALGTAALDSTTRLAY